MPIRHLRALHLFFGKEAIFLKCHCFGYNSSISSSSCEPIAYVQICANSYYHLQTRCFLTDIEKQKDPGVVSLGFIVEHMMSRELPQSGVPSIFEPFALKQKINNTHRLIMNRWAVCSICTFQGLGQIIPYYPAYIQILNPFSNSSEDLS